MVLKQLLERMRARKEAFNEVKQQDRINTVISERKKNANERELEKFMEKERQENIKVQLNRFREKEKSENRNMNILKGKNIFKSHTSVLTNNPKMFSLGANNLGGSTFFK